MLKKQNRLSTTFEFNIARKYGKKVRGGYFDIYILDAKNYDGPPRIGIVVSNRLEKSAAKRNRIKRVFREAVSSNLGIIKNGYWVVIHPRSSSKDKNSEEISIEINKVLSEFFSAR